MDRPTSPISSSQVIPSASPARKVAVRCRAGGRVLRVGRALTRRHSREAPLGSQAVKPSIWELARRAARRGACVARMAHQAARAPMHEIECVERLALDSLMRELLSSTACLHFEACLKASWEHTHLQSVMVDIGLKRITEGWRLRLPQRARWPSCMRMRRATRAAAAAPTPTSSQYSIPTKTYSSRLRYIAVAQHPPEQYLAATGVCGRAETRASAATLLRLVGA